MDIDMSILLYENQRNLMTIITDGSGRYMQDSEYSVWEDGLW